MKSIAISVIFATLVVLAACGSPDSGYTNVIWGGYAVLVGKTSQCTDRTLIGTVIAPDLVLEFFCAGSEEPADYSYLCARDLEVAPRLPKGSCTANSPVPQEPDPGTEEYFTVTNTFDITGDKGRHRVHGSYLSIYESFRGGMFDSGISESAELQEATWEWHKPGNPGCVWFSDLRGGGALQEAVSN